MSKQLSLVMIAPAIALVVVTVWFFGFSDGRFSFLDGQDILSLTGEIVSTGQTDTLSGNIIGYSDEGDTLEDIGLGDAYTSPWFADIDMVAGKRVEIYPQTDGSYVRQKQCRVDTWENTLSISTTDTTPSKKSLRYIRFMAHTAEEYRIQDFRYDGDDGAMFVIDMIDEDADDAVKQSATISRKSPDLIEVIRGDEHHRYIIEALDEDYKVLECAKE